MPVMSGASNLSLSVKCELDNKEKTMTGTFKSNHATNVEPAVKFEPVEPGFRVQIGSNSDSVSNRPVKLEAATKLSSPKTLRSKKQPPTPMNWTRPRPFRLPLPSVTEHPHEQTSYCYFWVVPNTSGLERTPVSPSSGDPNSVRKLIFVIRDPARRTSCPLSPSQSFFNKPHIWTMGIRHIFPGYLRRRYQANCAGNRTSGISQRRSINSPSMIGTRCMVEITKNLLKLVDRSQP